MRFWAGIFKKWINPIWLVLASDTVETLVLAPDTYSGDYSTSLGYSPLIQ